MKIFVVSALFLALASAEVELSNTGALAAEAQAEEQIREHNQKYTNGESSFLEKTDSYEFLDKEQFEKEREGGQLPPEEDVRSLGGLYPENEADRYDEASKQYIARLMSSRAVIPESYDARQHGFVSPVKNQQQCGSCAAFSATAVIESCLYKAAGENGGKHFDLAEQYLIDCGYNGKAMNACNGAWIHAYQQWIATNTHKLPHENSDLYRNQNPKLNCDKSIPLYNTGAEVSSYVWEYNCNEEILKKLILETGSVTTAMYASDQAFQRYSSGVFDSCSNTTINHAVTAVGWGKEANGDKYWIVKNSWGTGWGEGGFFRIKMGTCGIATTCATVTCQKDGTSKSPEPTTTTTTTQPPPPGQTCDISTLYGNNNITGNYTLRTTMVSYAGGKKTQKTYTAKVTCQKSICEARSPVNNACVYICGKTKC